MRAGIRTRLLGSFGIILVFVALVGALGLYRLGQATRALHDVADDEAVALTAAFELRSASLSLQRDLRTLVLVFTPEEKQKVKESRTPPRPSSPPSSRPSTRRCTTRVSARSSRSSRLRKPAGRSSAPPSRSPPWTAISSPLV